ncbi:FliM/FliN family flagellar motor switch protein [Burkholderia semiarida]|uniref:Surface presentation of antigens protein SpaO n=1 Tax=Burkholderia semiarida TaxID=2843303 RepID=A0ABW7LEE8_9BURK
MTPARIRRIDSAASNARRLLGAWRAREVVWHREPLATDGAFAEVVAYRDDRYWSGYVDLNKWLAAVAPQVAALARGTKYDAEYALRLFNARERPLDIPEAARELSYTRVKARLSAAMPDGAVAVATRQGPLWLAELPRMIEGSSGPPSAWAMALPVALEFRLGVTWLRRASLRTLRPGDVVLIRDVRRVVRVGRHVLSAFKIDEQGSIIVSNEHIEQQHVSERALAGGTDAANVADLPIRLDFLLHRCTMRVSDVDAFGEGVFLPLGPDAERRIEIVADGVTLATGELVELDGQLGVELHTVPRRGRDG